MSFKGVKYGLIILLGLLISIQGFSQRKKKKRKTIDTVRVEAGNVMIYPDTIIIPLSDTIVILQPGEKLRIKENPYQRSDQFFDSLENKTYKNKITHELHNLFIRSRNVFEDSLDMKSSEHPYRPFEGSTIAGIAVVRVDVIEGSVLDTSVHVSTGFGKFINRIHPRTRSRVILQNLLFKVGDKVDPFQFADNERILRRLGFFEDVRIMILPRIENPDSVDITVITQDVFPYGINITIGDVDKYDFEFYDRNFLGSGNRFAIKYRFKGSEEQPHGVEIRHSNPNIRGTFIRSELLYANTWHREGWIGEVSRDFLTPDIRWGGGVSAGFVGQDRVTKTEPNDTAFVEIPFKVNQIDLWLGHSYFINNQNRRNEILVTGGTYFTEFTERPFVSEDSNRFYHDRYMYIGSISFTNRKYFNGRKIRSFGRTEDVPTGVRIQFTGGYEVGDFNERPYFGFGYGMGNYFKKLGYMAAFFEIGGFRNNNVWQDATLNVLGIYFTPLKKLRRIQFRQFVELNYSKGLTDQALFQFIDMHRFIRGISGPLDGDERLALNLESNFFTNFYWVGFKMSFFAFADVGFVGYQESLFKNDNFYTGFGAGIRIRNESLVFSTIVISLGYYPRSNSGGSQFNTDFDDREPKLFRSFRVNKPQVVQPLN